MRMRDTLPSFGTAEVSPQFDDVTPSLKVCVNLTFPTSSCRTLIHNTNVCPNQSNNRILRGQTPQTLPQCLLHRLRNGLQPLPAPSNHHEPPPQSPPLDLPGRSDMHGGQRGGEGVLPARGEREGHCGALPGHEPTSGAQLFVPFYSSRIMSNWGSQSGGLKIQGEDDSFDFGSGAGFYVDATKSPWNKGYKMYSYVTSELPKTVFDNFKQVDSERVSIFGHSMGGHGALTLVRSTLSSPSMRERVLRILLIILIAPPPK